VGEIAIQVQNLSKIYRIGVPQAQYKTLREALIGVLKGPISWLRNSPLATRNHEILWALRDVSFEIKRGEVVGIIGRNGAGKTTLLKILSRITEPTEGRAKMRGRVGSLLEVGTGFHPELTGRENIYLNGAILGMTRKEIGGKLDEIVSFAEIEKFLDTPVKHYSSGMYVRLAFAVAAHLEPEILLVDEVLAVGDAAFQKKCLGKMGDVAQAGRTVLFVSHNMGAIVSLCKRCILIDQGSLFQDGSPSQITALYQSSLYPEIKDNSDLSAVKRYGSGRAKFTAVKVTPLGRDKRPWPFLRSGAALRVEVCIRSEGELLQANVALIIYDSLGYRLIDANTALQGVFLDLKPGQEARVEFEFEEVLLRPGIYLLGLWMGRHDVEDIDGITYATSLSVEPNPEGMISSINFPGVYQCRYSQRIIYGSEVRWPKME